MSSSGSFAEEIETEVLYEHTFEESSQEPPMSEWSSLELEIPEENKKKLLFNMGIYQPGSGEICTKYISMSDSAVLRHPYFNYPAIKDPGIEKALLQPEDRIIYPDDGQELYLSVCKEMNQCPVKIFFKSLIEDVINLRYYCVNPNGVRAMALALRYNRFVKVLDLTDNYLNNDACYHLGEMLTTNSNLQELILSGCKIGSEGLNRLLKGLKYNASLKVLNLHLNDLGDNGAEFLAKAVFLGLDVKKIYLSRNNIGSAGAGALAEAFETQNKFNHMDFSWNNFFSPSGTYGLISRLGENNLLEEVNLSWCSLSGPRIGTALKNLLLAANLKVLNLSNNRLCGEAIDNFIKNMQKAKKLTILDLSYNPMNPADAYKVIFKMKSPSVKIQKLLLDNIFVDASFLEIVQQIKSSKSKKNAIIKYGGVIGTFEPRSMNTRELLLNRAEFLSKKSKKNPIDIALVAMQLLKDKNEIMIAKDFNTAIHATGAPIDDDLIDEIVNVFSGPRTPKSKTIDIRLLVDYVKRKWPDRKLPPTPPPEPEPEPEPPKSKKGKGKK